MSREAAILQLGTEIFDRMPKEKPSVFKKDFWNGKIMDWSMKDEAFKIEMFRFVDVFPVLRTPESLARHIQEYFCRPEQDFPAWIQFGLGAVSSTSFVAKTAAKQIEKNIKGMAKQFVAGEDANDVLPKLRKMRKDGLAFTVDLLGEACVSEAEADDYAARYLQLIRVLSEDARGWAEDARLDRDGSGEIPRVNISIKISALYSQTDPIDFAGSIAGIKSRLLPLFEEAKKRDVFLNLDMEQYETKDLTFALFKSLLEEPSVAGYPHYGCVVQAYLRDSLEDTQKLVAWARGREQRITVRLVKGAYWDYETVHAQQEGWPIPVYQNKWETDQNYERCLEALLDGYPYVTSAIASHNVRSIAAGLAMAKERNIPNTGLEMQMLYGMAEPMKKAMADMGYRTRDYVPVGELVPGMAYLVRRLLENTSNEGFLRAKFVEDRDPALLLKAPDESAGRRADPTPDSPFINEAHTDFADAHNRAEFAAAIGEVRAKLGRHFPLFIGGTTIATERTLSSHNPANVDELIGTTACASREDADAAVRAAYSAFPAWRDTPTSERAALLRAMADIMRRRRHELSALMVLEVGKSWREADADVAEAIDFCRYYADEAERLMGKPHPLGHYPGEANTLSYQPKGVGAIIAPWNFPLAILTGMTMAAIATGNCVVVKPAEQSPIIAAMMLECAMEAGVPAGVINFLPGLGEEVGAALVEHPWTRFIAFTGSREVGLGILRKAYSTLPTQPGPKSVVCEMGGKNAIIVDDDADLDEAVKAVIYSAFGFQGQKCSACSRVIVLDEAYDAFVARLVEAAKSLEIGPPEDPAFAFGPVIDAEAAAKIQSYIELGRQEGTELVVREVPSGGHFVPFAIFEGIEVEHRLAQEEVFGPILAVMRASDFDDALRIANSTSYALTGAVISRSPTNLDKARKSLRVGNLYINRGCTGALVFRQPFGGFKYSGSGTKAGGPNYLHEFVEERSISENTMRRGFAPEMA